METILLKDYDKIPIMYDDEGNFGRMNLKMGDYYIMREPADPKDKGDVVSVYEVIRLTETGHESKYTMLRIE
jgi:hypothetical protein